MTKREIDDPTGTETTGHEWDGIKELNTPLPRWWLIVFYACIVWAGIYMVFMPAIPLIDTHTKGLRGHSDRANVAADVESLRSARAAFGEQLKGATLADMEANPDLLQFAMGAGRSAYANNCATCHGSGAQGVAGYPSLVDDVWLWGGALVDIRHTLEVGIRSAHGETRMSQMPSYGRDGLLTAREIEDVAAYVVRLSGRESDRAAADRGAEIFAVQCVSCHQADGRGDRAQGAPNLTDAEWLYGGDIAAIREQIYWGRGGVMPAWSGRLDSVTLDALAVYVHSLGGGE